jgi:hypothetical protein
VAEDSAEGKAMSLTEEFNGSDPYETDFFRCLSAKFDRQTAVEAIGYFRKVGLPPPKDSIEFLRGETGVLAFLNEYGLVIRIEASCTKWQTEYPDRIDDNPWIIKPLASIDAGEAVIEICPGIHQSESKEQNEELRALLDEQNIYFWDYKFSNIGRQPIKTVRFPEGVPVVVDRLATRRLTEGLKPISDALQVLKDEVAEEQRKFYEPLRHAFTEGWTNPKKMGQFWALCRNYVQEGKLVAGWNERQPKEAVLEQCRYGGNRKTAEAEKAGRCYATLLKLYSHGPAKSEGGPSP